MRPRPRRARWWRRWPCWPSGTRPGARASACANSRAAGPSPAIPAPRRRRGGSSAAPAWPRSRPEITRIRGVNADSAAATLLDRGLIEPAGHSQFGAVLYRTTTDFLKLFGLRTLDELPEIARWDPTPEEQAGLRERLLRAGDARAGAGPGER